MIYNIIGRGTAGILAAAFLLSQNKKLNWYYDSSISPVMVGEGTLHDVTELLQKFSVTSDDLIEMNGTYKLGLLKSGWSDNDFYDSFGFGCGGIHMSAVEFQKQFFDRISSHEKVLNLFDKNVQPEDIDGFVLDCSGTPTINDDFHTTKIPVNNAYVTQCNWGNIRLDHSLTIARPYGWVFGIPLQNRVSIGYLFNDKFNTVEDIKEDVKYIFDRFNLIPTEKTNHIKFKNYYRKENFKEKIAYCGNKSFFLEPLEATSLSCSLETVNILTSDLSLEEKNIRYRATLDSAENIIMLHYLSKNNYKTDFWKYARNQALEHFKDKKLDECSYFSFGPDKVQQHMKELQINTI